MNNRSQEFPPINTDEITDVPIFYVGAMAVVGDLAITLSIEDEDLSAGPSLTTDPDN